MMRGPPVGLGREFVLSPTHGPHRVRSEPFHAIERGLDREHARVERLIDFLPHERHRDRRTRQRPHDERRDDELAMPVLQVIEVDLVAALGDVSPAAEASGGGVACRLRSTLFRRASSSPNVRDWAYVSWRPSGSMTCSPVLPVVFT